MKCINTEYQAYKINDKFYPCTTSITMDFVGGKWKMVILHYLRNGKLRYSELRKLMPIVTERTLSLQLKQLEDDGLVKRTVYVSKPPLKVEYALTAFGETLIPLLEIVSNWGMQVANQKATVVNVALAKE